MLDQAQALDQLKNLRDGTRGWRMYYDAMWALSLAYANGNHWSWAAQKSGLRREIKALAEIIDPRRTDCRVVLDKIGRAVRRTVAATKPQRLNFMCVPDSGDPGATSAKQMCDSLLGKRLRQMQARQVWRSLQLPRTVLGTCLVRRQISSSGKAVTVPPVDQLSEASGQLRNLEVTWSKVLPFEILRDPSAESIDPNEDEVIFAQEKPRSVQWVVRNYAHVLDEATRAKLQGTETTLGQLLNYQDQLRSVTGWKTATHAADSKTPGVIVYEVYFQDADAEGAWPWQLVGFIDPHNTYGDQEVTPLHFGRNPFYGLPFHSLHYEKRVQGPWSVGLPLLMKQVQDIINLAATAMVRVMIDFTPKWRIQSGTVENLTETLTNRTDVPLVFNLSKPTDHVPDRIPAPSSNPVAQELLGMLDQDAMAVANLAPVQFGQMVKRGQSGTAYQTSAEQADVPLEDLRADDELVLNELYYATLIDTHRISLKFRPDLAHEMLDGDFPPEQVEALLAADVSRVIQSVQATPDSLRPKTAREVTEDFSSAVGMQLVDPLMARREMYVQGGVILDSTLAEAVRKQELEIEMMRKGQEVVPDATEDHVTAMWVCTRFASSPRWYALDDQVKQRINQHWALHFRANNEIQQLQQQSVMAQAAPSSPGVASPPAEGARANVAPPGPAGQGANVA